MTVENVVVIVLDALRADRVGAIASDEATLTPNIDALADEGTAFTSAFTCSPNTDSSITALETGRYPLRSVLHHGRLVTDEEKRRVESVPPVQLVLSERGWQTVAVGHTLDRWHRRGYDVYPESDSGAATVRERLLERAVDGYRTVNEAVPPVGRLISSIYDRVTDSAQSPALIRKDFDPTELLSQADDRPFFAKVHLMDTHIPYIARQEDVDRLLATRDYGYGDVDSFLDGRNVTDEQAAQLRSPLERKGTDSVDELLAIYDAAVMNADRKVGALVDALREAGLADETAIFVTSDHGESLLEHEIYFDHHGLYDPVMRVPLVTNLGTGTVVDEFVQEIDLTPTVLDLLGVDISVPVDGQSFAPLMTGNGTWERRNAVFAEEAYTQRRYAVRTEEWKLIAHVDDETLEKDRGSSLRCGYCETVHGAALELYDLTNDPQERRNVAEEHPATVERLQSRYGEFLDGLERPDQRGAVVDYEREEELFDQLESLGYK